MNKRDVLEKLAFDISKYTYDELCDFVDQDKFLDQIAKHGKSNIRTYIARKGKCTDILVHDTNSIVRAHVAFCGNGLDILVHDENDNVRFAAAGFYPACLELLDDPSEGVRNRARTIAIINGKVLR